MTDTKKTITRDDYLRLVGLLTLARDHNEALRAIERSAARIVDVTDEDSGGDGYFGHVTDVIGEDSSADQLLARLEIEISIEPEPNDA